MDTIFALASARGRAGVAVIRVSGPKAMESAKALLDKELNVPRAAVLSKIIHPVSRETIDQALVLPFIAPHSFTGEDVVEYHVHGGAAVIRGMLSVLAEQSGHRMAEPGEFTRRAFENGKMDLTEAEGLADLINAETQLQKAQAMTQMGGALSRLYEGWKDRLAKILAYAEAEIEFPDEDLPQDLMERIGPKISVLIQEISAHLDDGRRGERLREGIRIAVIGAPNAGKSSLINALSQRDVAIVSDMAGTTRDVIEVHLDLGGYPVILADTAGLRPGQLGSKGQDAIESEGIRRALQQAQAADIKILLYDGTQDMPDPDTFALEALPHTIPVINKADQGVNLTHPGKLMSISVHNGTGIPALIDSIIKVIQELIGRSESVTLTRERHRTCLKSCLEALKRSLGANLPELAAEDLRLAIRDIGRITGRVDIEDLLDIVFRDFCIGK